MQCVKSLVRPVRALDELRGRLEELLDQHVLLVPTWHVTFVCYGLLMSIYI